ncbi:MAG: lysophospholipid acyltransferase family protein [Spirochaetaceae bacterium]
MKLMRTALRIVLKKIGQLLLRGFTRHTIQGAENIPLRGPCIIAGNHRGLMEVFLMVSASPRPIEVLGAGDVPLDRRYRYVARAYGFIPYKRGQMDRRALMKAQKVLKRGEVVGIFPEGGIWKAGRKTAHRGVAWLSETSGAPVVPVGFGGITSAIDRALRLQKPRLETRIAPPLPAPRDRRDRRAAMSEFAEHVLDRIDTLIPEWDQAEVQEPDFEEFTLQVHLRAPSETSEDSWREVSDRIAHADDLARFFHIPVLVDVLYTNLHRRGLYPFRDFTRSYPAADIARAAAVVIGHVKRTNPAFLTYRLGDEPAARVMQALDSLRVLAESHSALDVEHTLYMRITPIHRWRMPGEGENRERHAPPPLRRF